MAAINTNEMPTETREIFDTLRKGNFIVIDHPDAHQRRLYSVCDGYFTKLYPYFEVLGYELAEGDGYFVFHLSDMNDTTKDNRLSIILDLLVLLELFHALFQNFGIGWYGSQADFATALKNDTVRRESMESSRSGKGRTVAELSEKAFKEMVSFGLLVSTGDKHDNYKCCSSYNYVKTIFEDVKMINATNEESN